MLEDYYEAFSTNPTTFRRFSQLPPELRIKIWQDALPGPRTIHLVNSITKLPSSPTSTSSPDTDEVTSPLGFVWQSRLLGLSQYRRRPAPANIVSHCKATLGCPKDLMALLHTCRESRFEALSRCQPLYTPKTLNDPYYRIHYFNPMIDGVFVDDIWPWVRGGMTKPTGLFNTRHLSISCNAWYFKWAGNSGQLLGKGGLLRFKHLEELHIVFRIMTDKERERIDKYRFGQFMGSGGLTQFLRRPHAPHDIAFPSEIVDIKLEPIVKRLEEIGAANPGWKVPKVKLMAWATRPDVSKPPRTGGMMSS